MNELHLADAILRAGLVDADQLRIVEIERKANAQTLEQALLTSGFISHSALRDFQGRLRGRATIDLHNARPQADVLARVPAAIARRHHVFPLSYEAASNTLFIAMEKAHDVLALDALAAVLEHKPALDIRLATRRDILEAIDRHYGSQVSIDALLQSLENDAAAVQGEGAKVPSQTCVQLFDGLLAEAARAGASDMHFEPEAAYLRLRYRVDGVLNLVRSIHKDYWSALLVRVKVLAGMNIAETRAAQDGRFAQLVCGRELDLRVSCFPSVHGENIVIRLLDRNARLLDIAQLGLPRNILERLRQCVKKPAGLIVMSGPTGSGKSTTLYSLLNEIRAQEINIVTLEDPVEYTIPLLRQCSINAAVKLDFASGVRSLLRQDPDVILVGETRDKATAEMVLRAALTGHLVLTTLHSQTALGALPRLEDLGLNIAHLSGNILALLAQRLVRKLCNECKHAEVLSPALQAVSPDTSSVFEAAGCSACNGSGYQGRQAIVELYEPSAEMHLLLACRASAGAVLEQVASEQHRNLAEQGLQRVLDGTTSLSELRRVIDLEALETSA